jgi:predicted ribosome quality control (RQC) complex YloA/Tae2 family protein
MSRTYQKIPEKKDNGARDKEALRAEIRRLKRVIKQLQKSAHVYENIKDLIEEPQDKEEVVKTEICQECGKGELRVLDLGTKNITTCTICDHRKVVHNGKEKTKKHI